MNNEIVEDYFISNNRIVPSKEAADFSTNSSRTIYEVIRVLSGIPIFLERHIERLEASARLVGSSVEPIKQKLESSICELIKVNSSPEKNIKILVYNMESSIPDYIAYFIQSSYPTAEEYSKGVQTILLQEERINPNAKVVNSSYKERVAAALSQSKAYEALLVNSRKEITEGSRSNLFFVRDGMIYTAPKGNVLIGITRVCVMELCEKLNIKIIEEPVNTDMLREIEGVFMTGTSPKILPIRTIDDLHFNSAGNRIINAIMKGYDDMLKEYTEQKRIGKA